MSRIPHEDGHESQEGNEYPDVNDNTYEVNVINTNHINPRSFATCRVDEPDLPEKPTCKYKDLDMSVEQQKDEDIVKIRRQVEEGTATKDNAKTVYGH